MYRIIRVENKLTGRLQFIIERKKSFLWMTSWTQNLGLDADQRGPVGAPSLDGAKYKLNIIKQNNGKLIHQTVDFLENI